VQNKNIFGDDLMKLSVMSTSLYVWWGVHPLRPSLCPRLVTCFARVCEIFTAVVSELQRGPHVVL